MEDPEGSGAARFARWRERIGDEAVFRERLSRAGVDPAGAERILGSRPEAEWSGPGAGILEDGIGDRSESDAGLFDPRRPLPFEHALEPFVRAAGRRLEDRAPAASHGFAAGAVRDQRRELLHRLCYLAGQTLVHEFSLFRRERVDRWERFRRRNRPGNELYDAFTGHLRAGDWAPVLEGYPVLGRLIGTVAELWIEAAAGLREHAAADRRALAETVLGGGDPGPVTGIRALSGDRHHGGRAVTLVEFADGRRAIHKPRGVALEGALYGLLGRIDREAGEDRFLAPATLDRGSWGWMEFVRSSPCRDRSGALRYYDAAGGLLAVLHALAAIDCTMENVVAAGEHPVLIDAETVLHPLPVGVPDDRRSTRAPADSVLATDFLPRNRPGYPIDVSGLAGGSKRVEVEVLDWREMNTDAMALGSRRTLHRGALNRPRVGGSPVEARDSLEPLLEGFRRTYRWLADRDPTGWPEWDAFAGRPVRYLPRSTQVYTSVLLSTCQPRFLQDGADWSIEHEILARGLAWVDDTGRFWPLVDAERRALARCDVPHFSTRTDGHDLILDDGGTVPGFFAETALERAEARLTGLGADDLARQEAEIEASLRA